ncbi:MAG: hypothetical protein FJZ04_00450 [Candidatus Moranbacteria bacterium]|nr:hypothetical protein [Candidatus Moranbacteria bacterium]
MRRVYKQILIIFTVILFLSAITYGIVWLIQVEPTCFDKIQNGEEEGIDCGAVCGNTCEKIVKPMPLRVSKSQVIQGGAKCDFVAVVTNPNASSGAQNIPYELRWGEASKKGEFYIYPSEERYIAEVNLPCQAGTNWEFKLGEPSKWEILKGYTGKPNLQISNAKFQYLDNSLEFAETTGIITNKSSFDLKTIEIYSIIKNAAGEVIAANKTNLNSLPVSQKREFRIFWTHSFPKGGINSFYLTTNLFDSENFLRTYDAESVKWGIGEEKGQIYYQK